MSFFSWKDKYSVGVEMIDRDHKILVDLIDQLHSAFVNGNVRETVAAVLDALVDYTKNHFRREEALMEQVGYPGLEDHRKSHAELTQQVIDIQTRFLDHPDAGMGNEVLGFLHDWLYFHILETDMAYRDHFAAKGMLDASPAP